MHMKGQTKKRQSCIVFVTGVAFPKNRQLEEDSKGSNPPGHNIYQPSKTHQKVLAPY